MKKPFLIVLIVILFISCSKKQPQRIVYPKDSLETVEITENNNDVKSKIIIELPQKLDSSNCIIFPLKRIEIENKSREFSKNSFSYEQYSVPLENLLFENIKTGESHILTTKKIKILSFEQLYNQTNTTISHENILIYKVVNNDSNKDGVLNIEDVVSLYLSDINGHNFKQISEQNQHLLEWKYISETKKIYFKTIEDIDKNGAFDNSDEYSIFSVSINNLEKVENLFKDIK